MPDARPAGAPGPAEGTLPGPAALVVFGKVPRPGAVKTRLVPPLTAAEAAALYDAFLRDALQAFSAPGAFGEAVAVRLYLGGNAKAPPGLVPPGVAVFRQRGADLGARMARAFAETFAAGYGRVVIVGTDVPTLPLASLAGAFDAVRDPRAVAIGPTDDGGYYALGLNDPALAGGAAPALFAMRYSHGGVFEDTLGRIAAAGALAVVLAAGYDVDDAEGLRRLVAAWRGGAAVPPRTAAALGALLDAHPGLL